MDFTLEPTHQPEATSEQVPVPTPTPTTELSTVDKKRVNKTATCPHCSQNYVYENFEILQLLPKNQRRLRSSS